MPLTAWKYTERNRHRDRKKVFTGTSGGCVIPVSNNSLNDSKFFRGYLVTIKKP